MEYDRIQIRRFLQETFSDEELTNFFFDYFPEVYQEISSGMTKSQKVMLLIDSCQRRGRFPDLLAALKRERPSAYQNSFPPPKQTAPRQLFTKETLEKYLLVMPIKTLRLRKDYPVTYGQMDGRYGLHQTAYNLEKSG